MISGLPCSHINNHVDQTILINLEKFQEFYRLNVANSNQTYVEVCADAENKVYRKCGNKCALSCRYSLSSSNFSISNENCNESLCIEGCFCKDGYVWHGVKCILAEVCPVKNRSLLEPSNDSSRPMPKQLGLFSPGRPNTAMLYC